MNKNKSDNKIKVLELFAGVGGFRLGLEAASSSFETILANQWEPGKKSQHAFDCYQQNFREDFHSNEDIAVLAQNPPKHDLLVGGFPCQDYSVARTKAAGIQGKKGVLWWEIDKIISKRNPKYILLENVDRLLKSPSSQRGRDFAIVLKSLDKNGYDVQWMVVNAADYGFVQRRRRVYIFAYKRNLKLHSGGNFELSEDHLYKGKFNYKLKGKEVIFDMARFSDTFSVSEKYDSGKFLNIGSMISGVVKMSDYEPVYFGKRALLGDILEKGADERYYLSDSQLAAAKKTKEGKREVRTTKDGFTYNYAEGTVVFPDPATRPARTMLTSESSINRSTHYVEDKDGIRTLTPVEAEKINGFPANWTNTGMPEKFRFFCMGNALVVGVIEQIGEVISELDERLNEGTNPVVQKSSVVLNPAPQSD